MAALFLIVLIAASGSFFGLKVARAHRGEPWIASRTFKSNMALIGPHGVRPKRLQNAALGARAPSIPMRRRIRIQVPKPRPASSRQRAAATSSEGLQFALALAFAACAFTFVCALLGMLPWEVFLGTLAATGLFVAFLLESRTTRARSGGRSRASVTYMRRYDDRGTGFDADDGYAVGGFG